MTDVKITWLGHAAFKIEGAGKKIYIDPWLENPQSPLNWQEVNDADLILVTHDHFDHTGQAAEIAKQSNGMVVANVETARKFAELGVPTENIAHGGSGLNIGGSFNFANIKITMTQAYHSTATGAPIGYVIRFPNGINIYHAGDTGIFSEMKLIGELYPLTVALLPIGDVFTMDAYQAAHALKLLKPQIAIPMHYGTFPIIAQNAIEFVEYASKLAPETKVVVLKPGEGYNI
ncbi:MAG: metal-dependent hydrolase [Candidatus Desulfofervidaceae bacterium]|nr:metal-dependent hydrolase [Candidatus Desulfofervidaceae bacterium]